MMTLGSFDIPISEYAPAQIKLAITGSGKATKKDVLDLIKSYNNDKAIEQASNIKTDIKDISKD